MRDEKPPADATSFDLALSQTFRVTEGLLTPIVEGIAYSGAALLQPGTIVDGNYRILSLLGEGGMGAVYRAHHLRLNKEVALKTFRSNQIDQDAWQRFEQEARALAKLSDKNIVQLFDFGIIGDIADSTAGGARPFYTMEILSGQSLAQRLAAGPLPLREALNIFAAVADGLAYAHKIGIVHRDIKPDNIFLSTGDVKIVDFGIAKLALADNSRLDQSLTNLGLIYGSPLYMSPEQSLAQSTDQRTDIYSFGCALFESLTGRPPFQKRTGFATILAHQSEKPPRLAQVCPQILFPQRLENLVARLLQKEKSNRPQSFVEVRDELSLIIGALAVNPSPAADSLLNTWTAAQQTARSKPGLTQKPGGKTPALTPTALVVLILLVVSGGAYLFVRQLRSVDYHKTAPEVAAMPDKLDHGDDQSADAGPTGTNWPVTAKLELPTKPLVKKYLVASDKNSKTFDFPTDQVIGYIGLRGHTKKACGRITFIGQACQFDAGPLISKYPELLAGFGPDDLQTIIFVQDIFIYYGDEHIKWVSKMTGLDRVDLKNCELSAVSVDYLNQLPKLRSLEIFPTKITSKEWTKLRTLHSLRRLGITTIEPVAPIVEALSGDQNLENITIQKTDLNDNDLQALRTCKNLERLYLERDDQVTIKGLLMLANLPKLKTLHVDCLKIGPEVIEPLLKFPALKKLELNTESWHAADAERLKLAMKKRGVDTEVFSRMPDKGAY